jgi:hypothetical protein
MKISDLLCEAKSESHKRAEPRGVQLSHSWDKTWQFEHTKFGDLTSDLDNFLIDKAYYDPPPAHGKKDYVFSASYVPLLKGMSHAHMHFGKVVIIYEVTANHVRLYLAGDHKIVESGSLQDLGKQLKRLKNQPWQDVSAPVIPVVDQLSPEINQAAQDWLQLLASDPARLNDLHRFVKDERAILSLLPYVPWEPMLANVSAQQLQNLVTQFLRQS